MSRASAGEGRIIRVDPHIIAVPFTEAEESATLSRLGFENVVIRIETAEGVVGWGEASGGSGAPVEAVRATIEALAPLVLGHSIFQTEALRQRLVDAGRMANLRRLAHLAAAGFDIACWDAAGQLLGRPIHELIGGSVRSEVDCFAYPLAKSVEAIVDDALSFVRAGFSVLYLKVGMGDARDEAVVKAVRSAVGPAPVLRVDANEAWDLATARRMSMRLEPLGIDFIEQPIDARNVTGMRELRRSTRVPVAANQGVWSVAATVQAIRLESCDVIVTGPLWLGGLLPVQRVGALCAESGVGFCLHAPPATSIGTAAGVQVLATLPQLLDGNQTYHYHLAADVSDDIPRERTPRLAVLDRPGLGITVAEDLVSELAERYLRGGGFRQTREPAAD